ncbi:MAG: hypothetical protein R2712_28350 [Vicinamibacterales bacterium]
MHYTGYVVPAGPDRPVPERADLVLVSAGGGRGGMPVLRAAIAAQRTTDLASAFGMRVVAGPRLDVRDWQALVGEAEGCRGWS